MTKISVLNIYELHSLLPEFSLLELKGLSPHIYKDLYYIEKIYDYFIIGYDLGDAGFKMIGKVDTLEEIKDIIYG